MGKFKIIQEYTTYADFLKKEGTWIFKKEMPYPFPPYYKLAIIPDLKYRSNWGNYDEAYKNSMVVSNVTYKEFRLIATTLPIYDVTLDGNKIPRAIYEEV
jgi:hypothetical protein